MNLPDRHMLLGMTLGAVCATALAAIGPGMVIEAFGDEAPAGIDPSQLVRYENRIYSVEYDESVSTDALSTSRVKKVEAGKVSYVTITRTSTGTYSSDALFSNHVQYPGISVEVLTPPINHFAYWSNGYWANVITGSANSFIGTSAWR